MRKPLHAIFFDLDDTLCATSDFTKEARQNAIQAMIDVGLHIPKEVLLAELGEVISEFTSNYPQHFDKLLLRIPSQSYEGINPAILVASAVKAYHYAKYHSFQPYPDVIPFLQNLIDTSPILLGIITDGLAIKQAEKLLLLKIYPYFASHAIFISEQIGISKVNPKVYQQVCRKMQIHPQHAIFIGDHPERDIDSANRAGWISVRIQRNGKYNDWVGKTQPTHTVKNLHELWEILQQEYELTSLAECNVF